MKMTGVYNFLEELVIIEMCSSSPIVTVYFRNYRNQHFFFQRTQGIPYCSYKLRTKLIGRLSRTEWKNFVLNNIYLKYLLVVLRILFNDFTNRVCDKNKNECSRDITKNLGTIKFRALYSCTSTVTSDKSSSQGTGKNHLRLVLVLSSTVSVMKLFLHIENI